MYTVSMPVFYRNDRPASLGGGSYRCFQDPLATAAPVHAMVRPDLVISPRTTLTLADRPFVCHRS